MAESVLVVRVGTDDVEACSDWLFQLGARAIEERNDPEVALVAGFATDREALAARDLLNNRWACRLEEVPDEREWRDQWLHHVEPIEVGRFLIHAPWHAIDDSGGQHISIDPGRAFGSGDHPTTRMAITALSDHVQPGDRVLDVGCGTGILSIIAARLGATAVTAIDLNNDIAAAARANIEANGVAHIVQVAEHPLELIETSFDIVVANIVIGDLRPLLARLIERTRRVLIISGMLEEQLDDLVAEADAVAVERLTLDGWSAATLRPSSTTPSS